jgi:transcriptional regulator with XRE-family HTH domain
MAEIAIEILASKLKEKRGGQGVRAVAKEIGISPATYSRVENNNLPDLETFRKLCGWVGIDPNEILRVDAASGNSAPLVHFKNAAEMSPNVAQALSELIQKAQKALHDEHF